MGPTASGKSALALDWARRRGARIVNADSMQVYRDLRVLTARPPAEDEATVPHSLYGTIDGADAYSVGRWLHDVIEVLVESGPVVVVGGTGLYFEALERGLAPVPKIPDDVRARWRATDDATLRRELAHRDPEAALTLRDRQRIIRALEVYEATGRTLREWQELPTRQGQGPLHGRVVRKLVLEPPRAVLRARIAQRFATMMEGGALDEVGRLLERRLDPALPLMRAIGVRELGSLLRGELGRANAEERAIIASRQYAKRQSTWFRNRMGSDWVRVDGVEAAKAALEA